MKTECLEKPLTDDPDQQRERFSYRYLYGYL